MKKLTTLAMIFGSALALQACVPAAIIGGSAVAGKVITDPRTVGTQIDDETLEERVILAINKDAQLRQEARINAVSYNEHVLLIGQVPNNNLKIQAGNITKGVKHVKTVYNELVIGKKIPASRIFKDGAITSQVKSKLLITPNINSTNVKVITENGQVYLMGSVLPEQAAIIINVVRNINGVQKVINAMQLVNN